MYISGTLSTRSMKALGGSAVGSCLYLIRWFQMRQRFRQFIDIPWLCSFATCQNDMLHVISHAFIYIYIQYIIQHQINTYILIILLFMTRNVCTLRCMSCDFTCAQHVLILSSGSSLLYSQFTGWQRGAAMIKKQTVQ